MRNQGGRENKKNKKEVGNRTQEEGLRKRILKQCEIVEIIKN